MAFAGGGHGGGPNLEHKRSIGREGTADTLLPEDPQEEPPHKKLLLSIYCCFIESILTEHHQRVFISVFQSWNQYSIMAFMCCLNWHSPIILHVAHVSGHSNIITDSLSRFSLLIQEVQKLGTLCTYPSRYASRNEGPQAGFKPRPLQQVLCRLLYVGRTLPIELTVHRFKGLNTGNNCRFSAHLFDCNIFSSSSSTEKMFSHRKTLN